MSSPDGLEHHFLRLLVAVGAMSQGDRKEAIDKLILNIIDTQSSSVTKDFFSLLKRILDNIVEQPKVPLFRRIDADDTLFKLTCQPVSSSMNLIRFIGFDVDGDTITFELADTSLLAETSETVSRALAQLPKDGEAKEPPPFVACLRDREIAVAPLVELVDRSDDAIEEAMQAHERLDEDVQKRIKELRSKLLVSPEDRERARQARVKAEEEAKAKAEADAKARAEAAAKEEAERKARAAERERIRRERELAEKQERLRKEAANAEERKRHAELSKQFRLGDRVVVFGLAKHTSFNGQEGLINGQLQPNLRWPVMLDKGNDSGKELNFKPVNIRLKATPQAAASAPPANVGGSDVKSGGGGAAAPPRISDKESRAVAMLMDMGFDAIVSRRAAVAAKGDIGAAVNYATQPSTIPAPKPQRAPPASQPTADVFAGEDRATMELLRKLQREEADRRKRIEEKKRKDEEASRELIAKLQREAKGAGAPNPRPRV